MLLYFIFRVDIVVWGVSHTHTQITHAGSVNLFEDLTARANIVRIMIKIEWEGGGEGRNIEARYSCS